MPLSIEEKLKLASASKKKKRDEENRVAEVVAFVNKAVEANIVHGKDGRDGLDGETKILHEYEPLPEDVVKRDEVISIQNTLSELKTQSGSLSEKQTQLLNLLSDKIDIILATEKEHKPVQYTFEIIRDDFGRINEVVAVPVEDTY